MSQVYIRLLISRSLSLLSHRSYRCVTPYRACISAMSPEASLRSYELFEALRNFEPGSSNTETLVKAIQQAPRDEQRSANAKASSACFIPTPLHTAVRCAKPGTVDLVLRHCPQDINARDLEGQTPLHIAAALGRVDVVNLLLSQSDIDDTLKDLNRKTALDVAKSPEVAKYIQVSRAQFSETYLALLQRYVATGPTSGAGTPRTSTQGLPHHEHYSKSPSLDFASLQGIDQAATSGGATSAESAREALVALLKKERSKCIDFTALTPGPRGTTIIHEAARRKDVELLRLCAARGASMVVRDRRGKMAMEVAKDDTVKQLLRQGATSEGRALKTSAAMGTPAPAMANLTLSPSPSGSVQSSRTPTAQPYMKGYLSKWTNMARGYRTRFFVLHNGHISYYRDAEEQGQTSRGTISMSVAQVELSSSTYSGSSSAASEKTTFTISTKLGKSPRWFLKANHPVEAMQWINALRTSIELTKQAEKEHGHTAGLGIQARTSSAASSFSSLGLTNTPADTGRSHTPSNYHKPASIPSSSSSSFKAPTIPTTNVIAPTPLTEKPPMPKLNRTNTAGTTGTNLTDDRASLLDDPFTRTPSPQMTDGSVYGDDDNTEHSRRGPPHNDNFELLNNSAKTQVALTEQLITSLAAIGPNDQQKRQEVTDAAKRSLRMLEALIEQHLEQVKDREKWFTRRYEREVETKRMWEENMRSVVSSQAELEQQLAETQKQATRRKKALKELKSSVIAGEQRPPVPRIPSNATVGRSAPGTDAAGTAPADFDSVAEIPVENTTLQEIDELVGSSSEDEDDFYDAVESGAVPLRVETPLQTPDHQEFPKDFEMTDERMLEIESYQGYKKLRDRLPLNADERPPVSLWAILKGSIGKDLTKISFPVYFNEPTSMLQRMAEDMEYSECLDAAASEQDSLKRLAFVAGFAMSNYASTIGRIAKPFNPMLSETFELVNLDKTYRYISEQVSHHPPISACIAESPRWLYYGEVDAKSKFLGKSFEIRPTGVAHADLVLPKEWCPTYDKPARRPGYVREHYSWKKVTTSVSNFIMGSPQIDHYGDMEITNHRTGEKCVLTFKPRGWKASNACEIKGNVYDAKGSVVWELAGRWNGQLVARRAGASSSALNPDDKVPTGGGGNIHPEYLLIWKINQQPPNMPFNLTRFALTLNDANEEIRKYLPPTDCRLRPDQHAFEDGQFEKANELKSALETFQRGTRAKREKGELPPHGPRWFERKVDEDTQMGYWEPRRLSSGELEYWKERNENFKRIQSGEEPHWKNVDEIFGIRL
ncbi:hypothetical protein P389DRAFT_168108 [Cystobasidium minutum MCA 4210]|uniref:uncharacterized protein n=1 Tax=Cystobasidium minutum MCA 4210 TaxID=1397322 RepID=UPI0034CE466C|eukprot:jgi/Rhomi1/168108/fgenesh1_kg.2_\